jgi:hypothetical protein
MQFNYRSWATLGAAPSAGAADGCAGAVVAEAAPDGPLSAATLGAAPWLGAPTRCLGLWFLLWLLLLRALATSGAAM